MDEVKAIKHGYVYISYASAVPVWFDNFEVKHKRGRLIEENHYDPQIGRFMNSDPFNQYASPYIGMGNDPANLNDPSGGFTIGMLGGVAIGAGIGAVIGGLASDWEASGIAGGAFLGGALGGAICEGGVSIVIGRQTMSTVATIFKDMSAVGGPILGYR